MCYGSDSTLLTSNFQLSVCNTERKKKKISPKKKKHKIKNISMGRFDYSSSYSVFALEICFFVGVLRKIHVVCLSKSLDKLSSFMSLN